MGVYAHESLHKLGSFTFASLHFFLVWNSASTKRVDVILISDVANRTILRLWVECLKKTSLMLALSRSLIAWHPSNSAPVHPYSLTCVYCQLLPSMLILLPNLLPRSPLVPDLLPSTHMIPTRCSWQDMFTFPLLVDSQL